MNMYNCKAIYKTISYLIEQKNDEKIFDAPKIRESQRSCINEKSIRAKSNLS